ncbi:MAG TPA: hypothetical protein VHS76_06275 [Steroidobacteraceae bacterium]|jgi:hypothetical protein|nr:hypothetical protein [Steroidobacteraceae bacterium]
MPSMLLEVEMISDRKRLITIHAAAVILVWLSSTPSLAEDTAVSHIRPSPFQAHDAAASPPKSVTEACENLRNLREQSGVYRDKQDCVAVQFQTTASETSPGKHAEAPAKLSPAVSVNSSTSAVRTEATISHLSKSPDLLPGTATAGSNTSADQSESYWSYLFDCKRQKKTGAVTGFSTWTFTRSNTMTEEKARDLVRSTGASEYFIEMTSPRVMRVARSGPWRVGWAAMMLTSGAISAYELWFCE